MCKIEKIYWNDKHKRLMKFVKKDFKQEHKYWEIGYMGGRNETYVFGMFKEGLYDYDIKNAYPLAMLSIQDVDWNNEIEITNEDINKLSFNDLGFLQIKFEFKDNVKYPLFAVKTDRGLIFPKKGETVITIPEFLTALNNNMLNNYYIKQGIKFKRKDDLTIPEFIKDVIEERSKYEKGTLENTIWKLIANSFYGKTAQGLTGKKSLDLEATIKTGEKVYKLVGKSKITNHFIAGYITGVIRAIAGEYLHYFNKNDILVTNVTTDGFMINTQLTKKELEGVGFITKKFSKIRKIYLNDSEILELKHYSDNKAKNIIIKTRGYWLEPVNQKDEILTARAGIQTRDLEKNIQDNFERKKAVYNYLTKNFLENDFDISYIQKNLYNIGDVLIDKVKKYY
jgi:hypothetical protein